MTASTAGAILGLVTAGEAGWLSPPTLLPILAGVFGYVLFVWRQGTARTPLIELGMLARRPVAAGLGLIFVATALMIAVFFLGSFLFQHIHGFTALGTGLVFLPIALGSIAGAQLGGRAIGRFGARAVASIGLIVAALGMAVVAAITSMTAVVAAMSIASLGIGLAFVASATSTFSAVAPHESGVGSGALSTFHELGAATGVSAVSSVAAAGLTGGGSAIAFDDGFWFASAVAAVAAVLAAALLPRRTRAATR